ncbi:MAG: hypothetical protein IJ214_04005 [Clostridia bacterium]|nr:hypothetical protein [Clostridia bacterium]
MRLSDVMKPAMEWSEAAMLPARVRTLSQGAALRQLKHLDRLDTALVDQEQKPAPAQEARDTRSLLLRRAAYQQIRRIR